MFEILLLYSYINLSKGVKPFSSYELLILFNSSSDKESLSLSKISLMTYNFFSCGNFCS